MTTVRTTRCVLYLFAGLFSVTAFVSAFAEEPGVRRVWNRPDQPAGVAIVKNQSSPHARLRSVDLTSVRWTEGFWAQRYAQANEVSLRKLWDLAVDVEAGHVIENLRIAGGLAEGKRAGSDWQDAWLYKWIESAASFHAVTGDAWTAARMDEAIALIAAAQEDDGYVATQMIPYFAWANRGPTAMSVWLPVVWRNK